MFGAMRTAHAPARLTARLVGGLLLALVGGCARRGGCTGNYCGTLLIAATGEPDVLIPPVSELASTRDVVDQVFLKLPDLGPSGNTIGHEHFHPVLPPPWEWPRPATFLFLLH